MSDKKADIAAMVAAMQGGDAFLEKVFGFVLWKLVKNGSVIITEEDMKAFLVEHPDGKANLIVQGTEDGMRVQVLPEARAQQFLDEYRAMQKGMVVKGN